MIYYKLFKFLLNSIIFCRDRRVTERISLRIIDRYAKWQITKQRQNRNGINRQKLSMLWKGTVKKMLHLLLLYVNLLSVERDRYIKSDSGHEIVNSRGYFKCL